MARTCLHGLANGYEKTCSDEKGGVAAFESPQHCEAMTFNVSICVNNIVCACSSAG